VGALVACNALGDVIDPDTGAVVAGARTLNGKSLLDSRRALLRGEPPKPLLPGTNTTLVVAVQTVRLLATLLLGPPCRLVDPPTRHVCGPDAESRADPPQEIVPEGDRRPLPRTVD